MFQCTPAQAFLAVSFDSSLKVEFLKPCHLPERANTFKQTHSKASPTCSKCVWKGRLWCRDLQLQTRNVLTLEARVTCGIQHRTPVILNGRTGGILLHCAADLRSSSVRTPELCSNTYSLIRLAKRQTGRLVMSLL